jgi:hypothetical protein
MYIFIRVLLVCASPSVKLHVLFHDPCCTERQDPCVPFTILCVPKTLFPVCSLAWELVRSAFSWAEAKLNSQPRCGVSGSERESEVVGAFGDSWTPAVNVQHPSCSVIVVVSYRKSYTHFGGQISLQIVFPDQITILS